MADPELDVEPEEFDDLPAFANDENKQLHAQVREREKALATIDAELEDTKERISVMEGHLGSVKTEQLHTQRLVDAKVKEIETEDHLKQLAERERGRFHAEFNKLTVEIAELQDKINGIQNNVFKGNEKMEQFKLQMNWNQEELEQWALASKQKEEDNLAIEKYTRADEAKINQLALQIEKLTKRDLEIQAQVEAEATETSSRQIELDRTAEEFRVLHAERQKLVQQWKETIEVAARRDQDITKTATEYVQQKQAKEAVDVDLKAAREDLDKVQALHGELQTEVTAREHQLQARREFLLSEQERKKKLEEEIDIIKTELVRTQRLLRCLHAIDARRLQERMSWLFYFSSLRPFGLNRDAPRRRTRHEL